MRTAEELDARAAALRALTAADVSFVVAGAYAVFEYTGIYRDTKDLDIFLRRRDLEAAFEVLERAGFRTEMTDPVWLAKGFRGEYFVDLIFSSGNGVAVVDDEWFEHASRASVMGVDCLIAPAEEMIWSMGFVNERERFDGNDINHLLYARAEEMDWYRLLRRFDRYWEVLFAHLQLYRFSYPSERDRVPEWVIVDLCRRTLSDLGDGNAPQQICRGNLISRVQYQYDLEHHGLADGRQWDERERVKGTEGEKVGRHGERDGTAAQRDVPASGGG